MYFEEGISTKPIDFIVLVPTNAFQHVLTVPKLIEVQGFPAFFGLRSSFCRHHLQLKHIDPPNACMHGVWFGLV